MKNVICSLVVASSLVTFGLNTAHAQSSKISGPAAFDMAANLPGEGSVKRASAETVSSVITSDLAKKFPAVTNVIWNTAGKNTWGYFKHNDIAVRVLYNEKSKLMYTLKYFNENQIPGSVTDILMRNGYTMQPTHVVEIKSRYATWKRVNIEDESTIVMLQISPTDEITVLNTFTKK